MTPKEASTLINSVGGDSAFARLLGIADNPGCLQRVNNWKRRGIPSDVILEHYDIFKALKNASSRGAQR